MCFLRSQCFCVLFFWIVLVLSIIFPFAFCFCFWFVVLFLKQGLPCSSGWSWTYDLSRIKGMYCHTSQLAITFERGPEVCGLIHQKLLFCLVHCRCCRWFRMDDSQTTYDQVDRWVRDFSVLTLVLTLIFKEKQGSIF